MVKKREKTQEQHETTILDMVEEIIGNAMKCPSKAAVHLTLKFISQVCRVCPRTLAPLGTKRDNFDDLPQAFCDEKSAKNHLL
jgi:hypothetical protein